MPNWGQGAQGAAGGAMTGAAIGSVVPGIGTAVGAIGGGLIGGAMGLFGDSGADVGPYRDQLERLARGYGNRTAPQGTAVTAGQSQLNANRAGLVASLEAMARGEGPSAAQLQMRDAMDRAAGAQSSAAAGAGGRGVNAGAAYRNAANNSAAIMAQGNRDMGILRAQEQANAMGQLGQVVGQGINADNSLATWNAGAQNQMQQANMQAMLQQLGLNDESQLRALLGAMGGEASRGPGTGSAILAGGAQAVPGIMQYGLARDQMNMQNQNQGGQFPTQAYSNMFGSQWSSPQNWNGYGVPNRTGMV